MSDLVIAVFHSTVAARAAGALLAAMQDKAEVEAEDIVVASRGLQGQVVLDQSMRMATGRSLGGGRWGMVIGMLFLMGEQGRPAAVERAGLDPQFLRDVAAALDDERAALGLRVRKLGIDRVIEVLGAQARPVRVIRTRMSAAAEAALFTLQADLPDLPRPAGL